MRKAAISIFLFFFSILASISMIALFTKDAPAGIEASAAGQGGHSLDLLGEATESSGARIITSEAYFWGSMEESPANEVSGAGERGLALELTREILQALGNGTEEQLEGNVFENDRLLQNEVKGSFGNGRFFSLMLQLNKDDPEEGVRRIAIRITQDGWSQGLEQIRQNVIKVLEAEKIQARWNCSITAAFPSKLEPSKMNEIANHLLKKAAARDVKTLREGGLISMTAYSPLLEGGIEFGGARVNLNLGIRYNSYEDRTYLWLATPVITTEY